MIVRIASFGLIAWILGFAWFGAFLPQPLDGRTTDAIVVLTGGGGSRWAAKPSTPAPTRWKPRAG